MVVAQRKKPAPKRLTREESRAVTREKLLASAYEVMAREGYEGASIDRIAEEAGFSKGAFYSNFESKDEIFLELLETHLAGRRQARSRDCSATSTTRGR